jgi:(p)ppGpp synthase/HD superfamily hydrolase
MSVWSQAAYLKAWNFAAAAHVGQCVPGTDASYLQHLGAVTAEVMAAIAARDDVADPDLAVQCAVLHDVVEDTDVTVEQVETEFGIEVAEGVAALTKHKEAGDKWAQMQDSLQRIRQCPPEVWMVKLADRITNLQSPPTDWSESKVADYRVQAEEIGEALASACPVLGPRLAEKIALYPPG